MNVTHIILGRNYKYLFVCLAMKNTPKPGICGSMELTERNLNCNFCNLGEKAGIISRF